MKLTIQVELTEDEVPKATELLQLLKCALSHSVPPFSLSLSLSLTLQLPARPDRSLTKNFSSTVLDNPFTPLLAKLSSPENLESVVEEVKPLLEGASEEVRGTGLWHLSATGGGVSCYG